MLVKLGKTFILWFNLIRCLNPLHTVLKFCLKLPIFQVEINQDVEINLCDVGTKCNWQGLDINKVLEGMTWWWVGCLGRFLLDIPWFLGACLGAWSKTSMVTKCRKWKVSWQWKPCILCYYHHMQWKPCILRPIITQGDKLQSYTRKQDSIHVATFGINRSR